MIYNATAGSETNLKNYVFCNDDLEWPLITAIYLGKQTQINTCARVECKSTSVLYLEKKNMTKTLPSKEEQ